MSLLKVWPSGGVRKESRDTRLTNRKLPIRDVKGLAKTAETNKGIVTEYTGPGIASKEELPPTKKQKGAIFASEDHSQTAIPKKLQKLREKGRKASDARDVAVDTRESKPRGDAEVSLRKRKLEDGVLLKQQPKNIKNLKKRKSKDNKDSGKEAVDKLDMLVEQYRSKFSQRSSDRPDGEKQGSRQLRRWFQS